MQRLIMQLSLATNVQSLLRKHLLNPLSCKNSDMEEKHRHLRKTSSVRYLGTGSTRADTFTVRPCHLLRE
jgi:hypothetical protein